MRIFMLLCVGALIGHAQSSDSGTKRKLWYVSLAAVAAANALDAHSSFGKQELNPALAGRDGSFGASSVGIKIGIQAPLIAVQLWRHHRHPSQFQYGAFSAVNFAASAGLAGVAIHNYRIGPPRR